MTIVITRCNRAPRWARRGVWPGPSECPPPWLSGRPPARRAARPDTRFGARATVMSVSAVIVFSFHSGSAEQARPVAGVQTLHEQPAPTTKAPGGTFSDTQYSKYEYAFESRQYFGVAGSCRVPVPGGILHAQTSANGRRYLPRATLQDQGRSGREETRNRHSPVPCGLPG